MDEIIPEYPRFISGTKARPSLSLSVIHILHLNVCTIISLFSRARRRFTMAKQRTMSIKTSIHKAGKKVSEEQDKCLEII